MITMLSADLNGFPKVILWVISRATIISGQASDHERHQHLFLNTYIKLGPGKIWLAK